MTRDDVTGQFLRVPAAERFFAKVVAGPDNCHVWTGGRFQKTGYGMFSDRHLHPTKRTYLAHRYAWFLYFGEFPDGMLDHRCRNKQCVNPNHLEPVTNQINQQRGNAAKLTPEQVETIRDLDAQRKLRGSGHTGAGAFVEDMCTRFGVSRTTVRRAMKYESWENV